MPPPKVCQFLQLTFSVHILKLRFNHMVIMENYFIFAAMTWKMLWTENSKAQMADKPNQHSNTEPTHHSTTPTILAITSSHYTGHSYWQKLLGQMKTMSSTCSRTSADFFSSATPDIFIRIDHNTSFLQSSFSSQRSILRTIMYDENEMLLEISSYKATELPPHLGC